MKIAIIGAGISGLTAAYHLSQRAEVTLFEKEDYAGGHARTVPVPDVGGMIGLDTGFIVFNETTYPGFSRMLRDLDVATQESEMSLSVRCRRCGIEWCGRSLRGLAGRPGQLLRPGFLRMWLDLLRFHRETRALLETASSEEETLGAFLDRNRYSPGFVRHYLLPMGAAIWSSRTGSFRSFPLRYFLGFLGNHGLLSISGQPPWRTVRGGSRRYVEALTRSFADRVHLHSAVSTITRGPRGVEIVVAGERLSFDQVILAVHADQALAMLADSEPVEAEALAAVPSETNVATLHHDARVLSANPAARASWNVHVEDCSDETAPLSMTYFLNRLQRLESARSWCVSLNDQGAVSPERVAARIPWKHPVYTVPGLAARRRLRERNGSRRTWFCGAWLGFGFHEDGVRSALEVVRAIAEGRAAA